MKLYSYFRSSCSYRVRIILNLKKIPFDTLPVHLVKDGGEQNHPEYQAKNPASQVPYLLLNEEKGIAQSLAIGEYLEEVYPDPPLLPSHSFEKAQVRELCLLIASGIQPIQNLSVMNYLKDHHGWDSEKLGEWNHHWISKGFEALERSLEKTAGAFSWGDQLSLADAFLAPQAYNAHRWKVDLARFPLIARIEKKCLEIDAFHRASPEVQPDAPRE